jgi:hypothetical protein
MEQFEATLEAAEHGPGCGIRLPFDPKEVFGRARAQVQVSVNNQDAFATTTMIYGGVAWVGLRRDQQQAFGVAPGDRVRVWVKRDDTPRGVDVPPELADALTGATRAASLFASLSYTHRREYARWVGEAKKAETRARRAAKAVGMLEQGVCTPG